MRMEFFADLLSNKNRIRVIVHTLKSISIHRCTPNDEQRGQLQVQLQISLNDSVIKERSSTRVDGGRIKTRVLLHIIVNSLSSAARPA